MRSSISFETLATKCKTSPVAFNYMFTPYFSKDITTLPQLHTQASASATVFFTVSDRETKNAELLYMENTL